MKILIFAFTNNISSDVMRLMEGNFDKSSINSSTSTIKQFMANSNLEKYDLVIGLGAYNCRTDSPIRIETMCSNRFRSSKLPFISFPLSNPFTSNNQIRPCCSIGTSWCNYVSYKIKSLHPKLEYSFLHIPKNFNPSLAASVISDQLQQISK